MDGQLAARYVSHFMVMAANHKSGQNAPNCYFFCFFFHGVDKLSTFVLFYDAFKLIVIKSLNIFCCCYSEDSNAKYEVYVPDGRGDMAQQLLTLPEIRTLLARQADSPADSDIISLEGGKVSLILELFY